MTQERPWTVCSVCAGTGMRPVERGPDGATWTDYERCFACRGAGGFGKRNATVGEQLKPE